MTELASRAQNATDLLSEAEDEELFEQLALRLRTMSAEPERAGDFAMDVTNTVETLGALDGLADFGRRYFNKVENQIHALVCGKEDAEARAQLTKAFGLGRDSVTATLAVLLVSHVGFAPAIAAVLAALTVRIFFKPAHEAMCEQWDARLKSMAVG